MLISDMALQESKDFPIGWEAPDFELKGADDETYTLADFEDVSGLVVVFTCNHCPYAKAAWPLLIDLAEEYLDEGIEFIAINPNDPDAYPEDSFERMKQRVIDWGITFPYLVDETQEVAKEYQARCTPDIYLFDENHELYYRGRINDNWQNPEQAEEENLREAIEDLLAGNEPPDDQPPSMGCSIKWK